MTIKEYCKPIHKLPVDEIGTADVLAVLTPMETGRPNGVAAARPDRGHPEFLPLGP